MSSRRRRGPRLTEADRALWRSAMRDATPLSGRDPAPGARPDTPPGDPGPGGGAGGSAARPAARAPTFSEPPAEPSAPARPLPPSGPARPAGPLRPHGRAKPPVSAHFHRSPIDTLDPAAGLDRRTADRLKRGRMAPQARLDLHGMTADRAHGALARFIRSSRAQGLRCVLVVTGKGGRKPVDDAPFMPERTGVLRHAVPLWLQTEPLGHLIVGVYAAHRSHGGEGALYIYLKKPRP